MTVTTSSTIITPDDQILYEYGRLDIIGPDRDSPTVRLSVYDLDTADRLVAAATALRNEIAKNYVPVASLDVGWWIVLPGDTEAHPVTTVTPCPDHQRALVRTTAGVRELAVDRLVRLVARPSVDQYVSGPPTPTAVDSAEVRP